VAPPTGHLPTDYLRTEVNRLKLEGMPEAPRLRAVYDSSEMAPEPGNPDQPTPGFEAAGAALNGAIEHGRAGSLRKREASRGPTARGTSPSGGIGSCDPVGQESEYVSRAMGVVGEFMDEPPSIRSCAGTPAAPEPRRQ
jgi:hypothetical protein